MGHQAYIAPVIRFIADNVVIGAPWSASAGVRKRGFRIYRTQCQARIAPVTPPITATTPHKHLACQG